MDQAKPHKLTPLAILLVLVLAIPGLIIGQLIAFVYFWLIGGYLVNHPLDWISGGWFSIILMAIFPNLVSGCLGGVIGVRLTYVIKFMKTANYEIVAYAVSAIAIALLALSVLFMIQNAGMNMKVIELVANIAGLVVGLFVAFQSIQQEQRRAIAAA